MDTHPHWAVVCVSDAGIGHAFWQAIEQPDLPAFQWDLWNEPDAWGAFWKGGGESVFFEMWRRAVLQIKRLNPRAKIIGPSFARSYNCDTPRGLVPTRTPSSILGTLGTIPSYLVYNMFECFLLPFFNHSDPVDLLARTAHGMATAALVPRLSTCRTNSVGLAHSETQQ